MNWDESSVRSHLKFRAVRVAVVCCVDDVVHEMKW